MRIISGELKGRRFYPPAKNWPTRPTTDVAKEALFNILQNRFDFENMHFLDLFGGTGSHSLECISRGCQSVVYVDKFPACVKFVRDLATRLGVENRIRILRADVFKYLDSAQESFDYIFAGPPYALREIPLLPGLIFDKGFLKPGGLFILEHNHTLTFSEYPHFAELRRYGQCHFSFFTNPAD